MDEVENSVENRDGIFEKVVRAGKRTYFFDVRATRNNDYYLTITESKKKYNQDGTFVYQKHKIFLYKEDFAKFAGSLSESINKVLELNSNENEEVSSEVENSFSALEFEDLGKD